MGDASSVDEPNDSEKSVSLDKKPVVVVRLSCCCCCWMLRGSCGALGVEYGI